MILFTEGSTDAQASEAEKVMGILCAAYPGHPWAVRVDKGIIFIRYLAFEGPWGMNIKTGKEDWSSSNLSRKIVMAAGEWLERAGLKRGRENGDEIQKVEGVPERKVAKMDYVIDTAAREIRDTPRPQALKELKNGN